jgi:hypothetical protein
MFSQAKPRELPCPICYSNSFTWGGVARIDHHTQGLRFFAQRRSALQKLFMIGGEYLVSRKCNGCGHVDLFTEDQPVSSV